MCASLVVGMFGTQKKEIKMGNFKDERKLRSELQKRQFYCECGGVVFIPHRKERALCKRCGTYVYALRSNNVAHKSLITYLMNEKKRNDKKVK